MDLPTVLAITGGIALLVGLFGGGIKAKEIEVPKIPVRPRIISSLVGLMLIGVAISLQDSPGLSPPPTATPDNPPESAPSQIIPTTVLPDHTPTDVPTYTPPQAPTDTAIPSPTASPTSTPEPGAEIIPFGAPGNPGSLNRVFAWQPGNSSTNAYSLTASPNSLALIANGRTDQWAELDSQPVIFYPLEGNFEAQVKVVFNPMWGHELAALGVRSAHDHLTWLRLGGVYAVFSPGGEAEQHIVLDIDHQGQGGKIKTSPYSANTFYLKIKRQGSRFDFLYSSNAVDWTPLQAGYVAELPASVEVFLTVGSWGDRGISAEFHEFTILRK